MARTAPALLNANSQPSGQGMGVSGDFERECVEFFADVVGVLGVPRSVGQIYGLLFSSPEPLSFTDIAARLDISKGSASQGLQALRALGAVHLAAGREMHAQFEDRRSEIGSNALPNSELRTPNSARGGSRRELYVPELGLRRLVSGVLREKVEPIVKDGGARVKTLRARAESAPTADEREFSIDRVKQIEAWRRQMRLLLPLLKTILGPKRD